MRIAFVVADLARQSPTYGSIYLARAARVRGHEVVFVSVDDLTFAPDNRVLAQASCLNLDDAASRDAIAFGLANPECPRRELDLGAFDVVFLRYGPREAAGPGLMPKLNPAIEFGWRLRLGGTIVINDPQGMQQAGGRMYLSALPSDMRPRTLITRSDAQVKDFLKRLAGPAIIKPLAGGGVENVFYVEPGKNPNLNQILSVVKKFGYVIVQEYLPEAREGDKRILLMDGQPVQQDGRVAIYKRVRPAEMPDAEPGAARAERRPCEYGPAEQRLVEHVRPKLLADGLYLCGMDIVGNRILELNVHTPGGFHTNATLYGLDAAECILKDLERRVRARASTAPAAQPPVL
jgi:glutathione synthase